MCQWYKSFENPVGEGEITRNQQFLLLPQCFLPFWRTFCHFHKIQNCLLQTLSIWKSCLKFVIWERVKKTPSDLTKECEHLETIIFSFFPTVLSNFP